MTEDARRAAKIVAERAGVRPAVGLILGSGLGSLADRVEQPVSIDYGELPGFTQPSVEGHGGRLVLGNLAGMPVACMQGRVHLYEGMPAQAVQTPIRTLQAAGCEILLVTNAAGSLNPEARPGGLMVITDHINLQFCGNPLVGPNDDSFGPRFPPMSGAYDEGLRQRLHGAGKHLGLELHEGVYISCLGPAFETPAEIRMLQRLGGDAVGMSTVPEVIVARHCGLEVAAVSVLTNMGAGMSDEVLSHEQTLREAGKATGDLARLVMAFLEGLAAERG